jgi:hypothetical protein
MQAPSSWTLWTATLEGVTVGVLLHPLGLWAVTGTLLVLGLAYGDMWLRHREEFTAGLLRPRLLDGMSALHAVVPFLLALVLLVAARTFGLPLPPMGLFIVLWSLCAVIVLADILFILPPAIARSLCSMARARPREDSGQTGGGS